MSPTGKVLILGSDNRSFLAVVRSLGRRGLTVHVGWCPPDAPAIRSRYIHRAHTIPSYAPGDDRWKRSLTALMLEEQFDLVIPCDDPTLIPLQQHKSELTAAGHLYVLDDMAFEIAFNKLKSYELAKSLGLPVARGTVVSNPSEVEAVLSAFELPVVIKPRSTFDPLDLVNRNSVRKVLAAEELRAHLLDMTSQDQVLVQENFAGTGAGVEVLAHHGEVLVAFQHVRVHEPLSGGGSSYRKSVALHPDLREAAEKLVRALRYTGVAMVEFKVNFHTGQWVFIEINGRFWGSLPLALAAGADFPYYLYRLLVHKTREFPQHYRTGLYCRNLWLDAIWMLQNFKSDHSDPGLARRSAGEVAGEAMNALTLRERSDTLVLDDPKPGLAELAYLVRVLWRKVVGKGSLSLMTFPPIRALYRRKVQRRLREAKTLLFVCKGNICRSPFAQQYALLSFPPSVKVASCGYYPKDGRACPREAVSAARAIGVDLSGHRSRVLSEKLVRDAHTIFTFDEEDYKTVLARHALCRTKVYPLGLFAPQRTIAIRDPYGGDSDSFKIVYQTISSALDSCAKSLIISEADIAAVR